MAITEYRSCALFAVILGRTQNRSKKSRSREYNYLIISIIKNFERASTAHARESRDYQCEVPNDVKLTLPADSVYENGVVELGLLHV